LLEEKFIRQYIFLKIEPLLKKFSGQGENLFTGLKLNTRVVKNAQKTVQRRKSPKVTVLHRPAAQRKRPQSWKNLFPFSKKKSGKFFKKYFSPFFCFSSRHLKIISNQIFFQKFFDFLSWWHPRISQRQLIFSSETDVIYLTNSRFTKLCLFRQTLLIPLQLMNKPSATSLKRVQVTENNPPHKAKISWKSQLSWRWRFQIRNSFWTSWRALEVGNLISKGNRWTNVKFLRDKLRLKLQNKTK